MLNTMGRHVTKSVYRKAQRETYGFRTKSKEININVNKYMENIGRTCECKLNFLNDY